MTVESCLTVDITTTTACNAHGTRTMSEVVRKHGKVLLTVLGTIPYIIRYLHLCLSTYLLALRYLRSAGTLPYRKVGFQCRCRVLPEYPAAAQDRVCASIIIPCHSFRAQHLGVHGSLAMP